MYLIRKDGMWLMNYQPSGCKEILGGGTFESIYTCLWGDRKQDAKPFEHDYEAKALAKRLGAEVVRVQMKGKRQ